MEISIYYPFLLFLVSDPFEVRLAGGRVPWEGRIEVKVNDVWGRACNDWDHNIRNVLCKQLGYSSALDCKYDLKHACVIYIYTLLLLLNSKIS